MPRQHPTDFIHGLLSSHAYKAYKSFQKTKVMQLKSNVEFGEHDKFHEYNELLKGWEIHKIYNDSENPANYYSVLYANKGVKQAVLAYPGISVSASLAGWNGTVKAGCEMFQQKIGIQQQAAYDSTQDAVVTARTEGYNLSFTGHALGAWLAELSLYFCEIDCECDIADNIKSVTFNSPGTATQIANYRPSIHNSNTTDISPSLNMVTYLSAPNLINICHGHIGTVYRVFSEIPQENGKLIKGIKKLLSYLPNFISDKQIYIDALLAIKGYNLDLMLAKFDPATGIPETDKYREVLDWPCIKYTKKTNYLEGSIEGALTLCDAVSKCAGGPKIFGTKAIAKVSAAVLYKLIPETTAALASIIVSFLNGDTDLVQLFETYKKLDIKTFNQGYAIKGGQTEAEEFSLKYKGHYRLDSKEVNPRAVSIPQRKGSLEWYMKKLSSCSETVIMSSFSEPYVKELLALKGQYYIEVPNDKGMWVIMSKTTSVEELKDDMGRLLKGNKDIKKVLAGVKTETSIENKILKIQEETGEYVKTFSANNVTEEQRKLNHGMFKEVKELVTLVSKCQIHKFFMSEGVSLKHLLNILYCMHALASYDLYDSHDGQNAREILLSSKKLVEQFVLHRIDNKFKDKVKANFDTSDKDKIYIELKNLKHLPEMYTSIIYLLGRTYIYQHDENDGEKYFELSKYLGEKLGLFEGYLSDRSGLGVIKMCQAEEYVKKKEYQQAEKKLNEAIEFYKQLKVNNKIYKNEYKPIGEGEYKEVTPTKDAHNQVECSERLIKCYMHLIMLPNNEKQLAEYVSESINQFIGSDKFPGILKQFKGIPPKKTASIYNSLGLTLLNLFDKKVDLKQFMEAIVKELQLPLMKEGDSTEDTDLSFIKLMFTLAEKQTRESDFAKANAHNGLSKVCERQLKQEKVQLDPLLKKQLENEKSKHEKIRDEINEALKRGTKKDVLSEAKLDAEVAASSAEIETETTYNPLSI